MTHTDLQGLLEGATLAECPPGLFLFNGTLGFKTEYSAMRCVPPFDVPGDHLRWTVSKYPDAYCVESGEYFWGGTDNHEDRAKLIVQPIERADLAAKDARIAEAEERFTMMATAVKNILPIGDASKLDSAVFPIYVTMGELRALHELARALHQSPEEKGV